LRVDRGKKQEKLKKTPTKRRKGKKKKKKKLLISICKYVDINVYAKDNTSVTVLISALGFHITDK